MKMKQSNLRESNDDLASQAQIRPPYLKMLFFGDEKDDYEMPSASLATKSRRPQRPDLLVSENPPLVALGSSIALSGQSGVPNTITCLLHPFTSSIVSLRRKLPPATGQVFILKIFVLRGRKGGAFFDGGFQRMVGHGKFSASGAKVTQLAGGHVDLSISAFLGQFCSRACRGADLMRLRIRRDSIRGMPMSRQTTRAGRTEGGIHRENFILHGEAYEFSAKECAC